ncbi:hypothetical protein V6Z12_A07G058700 [Gossypium hirsutum]
MSNKRPFVSRNSRTFGERLLASCQGSTSATTFSLTSATGCRATTGAQTTPRSSPSSAHHASVLSRHRDPRAHLQTKERNRDRQRTNMERKNTIYRLNKYGKKSRISFQNM